MWFKAKMWLLRVVAPIILVIVRGGGRGLSNQSFILGGSK